jgi:hypothetical protein
MFDLTPYLPKPTFDLQMMAPGTLTPIDWVITLAGPGHPKTVAHQNLLDRERLQKEAAAEASQMNGRKAKPDARTPEGETARIAKLIASRIVTWTPLTIGDKTYEYSDDVAEKLLTDPNMYYFVTQIADYLGSEKAFLPASASN